MEQTEEAFMKELRAAFEQEAAEHLESISGGLIELEKHTGASDRERLTETVFRAAHSLKGAARAVDMPDVGNLCQALESVFSAIKRCALTPTPEQFDLLHQAARVIGELIGAPPEPTDPRVPALIGALSALAESAADTPTQPPPLPPAPDPGAAAAMPSAPRPDTVRIRTEKLETLLMRAEQMLAAKLAIRQRAADLREIVILLEQQTRAAAPRPSGVQPLSDAGLRSGRQREMAAIETAIRRTANALQRDQRSIGDLVDELLQETKHVLMLPFSTIVRGYPRMVRGIAREQGKDVTITVAGDGVELDKRILEQLQDPLTHLLRNSIDHGIETPRERRLANKPPGGVITVTVAQVGGSGIAVRVEDDGRGIDVAQVIAAAVRRGILSESEAAALPPDEALSLLFRSGVSTHEQVTPLSGRGLGLAIVRDNVEKLGGSVQVEPRPGVGASFRLQLPVTISTFRAVVVRAGASLFAIPSGFVDRVVRTKRGEVHSDGISDGIVWQGSPVPLARLDRTLRLANAARGPARSDTVLSVIVASGGRRVAFCIDEVLNEQEVLVKDLAPLLSGRRILAGATILGTGRAVPILDASELIAMAGEAPAHEIRAFPPQAARPRARRVLVVEDSITSRMLLKNLIEAAGFEVRTAVDGVAALAALNEGACDLVVSDIEMPELDGIALAERIRRDERLKQLPIVLVTSRDSPADRERGLKAGANAYIVKSRFDQDNLLASVRRLTS